MSKQYYFIIKNAIVNLNFGAILKNKKSPFLFFVKFLSAFTVLYFLFPLYWGLTGTGGKMYSPFLAKYFNLIEWFASFLTNCAEAILNILGYKTFQRQYNVLRIEQSRGIIVNPSCLGWGVMSFWFAFVFANEGTKMYKAKWIAVGLSTIITLNIFRIALIALANHLKWTTITGLDHHQTFNIASYGCVFILMFIFIQKHSNIIKHKL